MQISFVNAQNCSGEDNIEDVLLLVNDSTLLNPQYVEEIC